MSGETGEWPEEWTFFTFISLPKNSVPITEQLLSSHTQARSFFGSYWKEFEQMNRQDSDKEGGQETKS